MIIPCREDEVLTSIAKQLFGDIVSAAYISTWSLASTEHEIQARLDDYETLPSDKIDFEDTQIYIEFTNGNLVEFSSHGWAHIGHKNKEDVKIM